MPVPHMWRMVSILYLKDVSFDNHCLLQTKWEINRQTREMCCFVLSGIWFFFDFVSLTRFLHFKLAFYYLFFPLPLDIYIFSLLEFSIYLTLCGVWFFLFVLTSLRWLVILLFCGFSSYLSCHLSPASDSAMGHEDPIPENLMALNYWQHDEIQNHASAHASSRWCWRANWGRKKTHPLWVTPLTG